MFHLNEKKIPSWTKIKIWAQKDGEFGGTCASQSPFLNKEGESCGFCGKTPEQFENCSEEPHK